MTTPKCYNKSTYYNGNNGEGENMDREVDAMGYGICIFSADTVQDFLKREKIRKRKLLSLLQKDKELYLSTQKEGILIALVGINAYNYAIRLEGRDEPFDDRWVQKIDYDGFNLEIKDGLWISNIRQLEPFEPKIYHEKEEEFYTTPGQFEPVERYRSPWERWYKAETGKGELVKIYTDIKYDVPAGKLKQYPDGWRYYAHHRMLRRNDSLYYDGAIGGKTGYTLLAGNTLVTCAERDGMKLIAVVLNGHQTHYSDTKALFDYGFKNFKSVPVADQDSTYSKVADDLTISGIFSGSATRLTVNKNSAVTLPADGNFSDVTSTLDYDLTDDAPDGAIARIDYRYGDKLVGQAYLEATVTQGYVPGAVKQSTDTAETETVAETVPSKAPDKKTEPSSKKTGSNKTSWTSSPAFGIVKKVLIAAAVIGAIGAAVFGIMIYQENKAQNERFLRHQRREKRLKEWGYSSTEFDMIMEEHLRSKSGIKQPGFREQLRDRFRRR